MSRPGPSRAQRIERRAAERGRRDGPPVMPIPDSIRELPQVCPNCAPGYDCERGIYEREASEQ